MRQINNDTLNSLTQSRSNERIKITALREGEILAENLTVSAWSYKEDRDQQIKGNFTCTIIDQTGNLIPYTFEDTLSPAGTSLLVDYVTSTGNIRLGEFAIVDADPQLELYLLDNKVAAKSGSIKITCKDLTTNLVADRLIMPESPPLNATVESEIKRLSRGMPVIFLPGTTPTRPVPTSVVYKQERMNALDDLASRADGFIRMGEDGALQIVPLESSSSPVWNIVGGETGAIIRYDTSISLDGVYNAVISTSGTGQDASQVFVGEAYENTGPLRWGGPVGYRPLFHSSSLISSQASADKDATTRLKNLVAARNVILSVECLPNPALQVGDIVALPALIDGRNIDTPVLKGEIVSISFSGDSTGIKSSALKVKVASNDFIQAINQGI